MIDFKKELKDLDIIDAHMHLGYSPNIYYHDYKDEKVIEQQKRFGVRLCICSHIKNITGSIDDQVEMIEEASEKFGGYVYWYMIYNPAESRKSIRMIDENRKKINFAGVKIHPVVHNTPLDDPGYLLLWEYAEENEIVILSHTWSPFTDNPKQFQGNPLLLDKVLSRFNDLKIILGHAGGKASFYPKVIDFAAKFKDVYLEFSGDTFLPDIFRRAINKVGPHKILFGTDMPWIDIRYHLINVLVADISQSEKSDIFYRNASKLFNLNIK